MTGSRSSRISAQRGIAMVVVVILFLVTMVLCFTTILLMANAGEKEQILLALDNEDSRQGPPGRVQQLQNEQAKLTRLRTSILPPTGLSAGGGADVDVEVSDTGSASDLPVLSAEEYLGEQREKLLKKHFGDGAEKLKKSPGFYGTLQELSALAAMKVISKESQVTQARMELELAQERKSVLEENDPNLSANSDAYEKQLNRLIDDLNVEVGKTTKNMNSDVKKLDELIGKATADLETLNHKFGTMDDKYRLTVIPKLQNELEKLKVRDVIKFDTHRVHGRIISPDNSNKIAFIDLGSRERIVPGLKFMVAKKGKQGKFVYKGKVEVKKVWLSYSEVAITDLKDADMPIVDGDLLVNPLFNTRRPIVVAFLGESEPRKIRPAWSINEASRRILEIGSQVLPLHSFGHEVKVGTDTVGAGVPLDVDFVIYTESRDLQSKETDPVYKLAVLIGVPVAEASEMYKYLED